MVKEFTYRGLSQNELEKLPLDELFKLFPARARRSLTRGINDDKRKYYENKFSELIESNLREGGYGDTSVNKNMKLLVKLFYAILLNCEKYSNLVLKKKIMLFDKYISINKDDQNQKLNELVKYFDKYESFCFSLPLNSVIKGELNFIY